MTENDERYHSLMSKKEPINEKPINTDNTNLALVPYTQKTSETLSHPSQDYQKYQDMILEAEKLMSQDLAKPYRDVFIDLYEPQSELPTFVRQKIDTGCHIYFGILLGNTQYIEIKSNLFNIPFICDLKKFKGTHGEVFTVTGYKKNGDKEYFEAHKERFNMFTMSHSINFYLIPSDYLQYPKLFNITAYIFQHLHWLRKNLTMWIKPI